MMKFIFQFIVLTFYKLLSENGVVWLFSFIDKILISNVDSKKGIQNFIIPIMIKLLINYNKCQIHLVDI